MLAFLHVTDGGWKTTRQMSHGCLHTHALLTISALCVRFRPLSRHFSQKTNNHNQPIRQIHRSEALRCWRFLFLPLPLFHCAGFCSLPVHFHQRSAPFLCFPLSRSVSPWSSGDKSLFYCREFLSHCTTDSVLRHGKDQTQSSLPPSRHLCLHLALITEIVEGWRGGWGRCWRKGSHHYTLGEERRNGRMHNMLTRWTEEEEENEDTKKNAAAVLQIFDRDACSKATVGLRCRIWE